MVSALPKPWTVDEFLDWEAQQPGRHEFADGVIVSMGGGTLAHAAIRDNLTVAFRDVLRGSSCRSFSETVKVVTSAESFYPDLLVTCEPVTLTDDRVAHPTIIIEVLSRTTADRDRGAKWVAYQEIETLQHYVLVAQDQARVDCFTRASGDGWQLNIMRPPATELALNAIHVRIPLPRIYEGTNVPVTSPDA